MYIPFNYANCNLINGTVTPSTVKNCNNVTFAYWERTLFQRASYSIVMSNLPWSGSVKDFLFWVLFRSGYVAVFDTDKYGLSFQPCTLTGFDFYYQPVKAIVSNPALQDEYTIGKDCEILKLTPDYMGIWDIIYRYASKLAMIDSAIDMSIVNNKFAYATVAGSKSGAEAIKKMYDKINSGEPIVVADKSAFLTEEEIRNGKDNSVRLFERSNLKQSYLTTDQLADQKTILRQFDEEIGIPSLPYEKKERLTQYESESNVTASQSRINVWIDTLNESAKLINDMFNLHMSFESRYKEVQNVESKDNINRA